MTIQRAYDISHVAVLDSIDMLHLPMWVRSFVKSFLRDRTPATRIHRKVVESFVPVRGMPQESILTSTLYKSAPILLAGLLHNVSTVKYLVYADNLTVWSTHHDLSSEESALLLALDVTRSFLQAKPCTCL